MNNDLQQYAGNSFTDLDLEGMAHGNNPVANAYRELLAFRRAAGQDKPVAVLYKTGDVLTREECADDKVFAICCKVETPLYTTPQPTHTEQVITLDYLQGHADGLEWAARTAEACNPFTSDWLYDEPEALAAAIRKGPEMPPVPPVSSPVIPDGWKLVPIEPSERMVIDGFESDALDALSSAVLKEKGWPYSCRESAELVRDIFKTMLAAAPKPESE